MYVYVSLCTVHVVFVFICCIMYVTCGFMYNCMKLQHQPAKGLQMETSLLLQSRIFTGYCSLIFIAPSINQSINQRKEAKMKMQYTHLMTFFNC